MVELLLSILVVVCVDPACHVPVEGASVWVLYEAEAGGPAYFELVTDANGAAVVAKAPKPKGDAIGISTCRVGYSQPCRAEFVPVNGDAVTWIAPIGEPSFVFLPMVTK